MVTRILRRLSGLLLCAGTALSGVGAAQADASRWDGDGRASMRLVTAGRDEAGALRAGLEIRLGAGWKTYWRYPGDSGIPPRFDWSKSENVKSVEVRWPAPVRFTDEGGASIGYKSQVLLPLIVTASDASRPALLRLSLDYAVCERLCVPAAGKAELRLDDRASPAPPEWSAAQQAVPARRDLGEPGELGIRAVRAEPGSPPRILVDAVAPPGTPADLFAEGPDSRWALPLPSPIPGAPAGEQRFAIEIDGVPPGQSVKGAILVLTLVAGGHGVEVRAPLD